MKIHTLTFDTNSLPLTAGVPPPTLSDDEFKPLEQVTNIPQQEEVRR